MMAHLLDALDAGQDIGHYGRLVFAIVARHFLSSEELVARLSRDPSVGEREARGLLRQVKEHDYSPPRREKILAWQREQDFPIILEPNDPDAGNAYDDLRFPHRVYEHIAEYYEEKSEE
jgi:hypothetical protein